ncbi:MAG TPA: glycoside hydrolase family 78 protein, partial [Trueperaceae bacterium]
LGSGRRYDWIVTAWDEQGQQATSSGASWEMGLLTEGEWQAEWIGLGNAGPFGGPLPPGGTRPRQPGGAAFDPALASLHAHGERRPSPYLRNTFSIGGPVRRARVYATARGVYELRLNGKRVGDTLLAPGWTDYDRRIQYQTYDVTDLLRHGENVIGAALADGWYSGYLGFDPRWRAFRYGYKPSLLLRLEVELEGGQVVVVVSDASWRTGTGKITFADLLMGEAHDARLEPLGWDEPGFDDATWHAAATVGPSPARLVAQQTPPVRVTEELSPVSVMELRPGVHLFDLGQNMVGWARLVVEGKPGTVITLRYGEMLGGDGELYTANLRSAKQTDVFVLRGEGTEVFEPRFTFHGFRYVQVEGLPGAPTSATLTGCVIHDDLQRVGEFDSSSELLNRLHANTFWGQRGNFVSVPTDCPQRDERLGWLGDAQVFMRTATFLMDVAPFFTKWLDDVADAQSSEGAYSDVAPRAVLPSDGAPGWGDGGVIMPWTLYQVYGDRRLLERHYEGMQRWMDYLGEANPGHLRTNKLNMNFGDWLSVDADTPKEVLATAYYALDAGIMARVAEVLGLEHDASRYRRLYEDIKSAFVTAYVSDDGRVHGDTQTSYLLALHAGLVPEPLRGAAVAHLVEDIRSRGGHLSTGFLGVSYLGPVLTDCGHANVAYELALKETYPSWGYSIAHGATTIWERWDGWTEERGFQTSEMNSFNHYAYGSITEWFYRYVAGIEADSTRPGYRHILLRPRPGGGVDHAAAVYRSIRGPIESRWKVAGGRLSYRVTVPPNTTATLYLPTTDPAGVTEGGRLATKSPGIEPLPPGAAKGVAVFELASGMYSFEAAFDARPQAAPIAGSRLGPAPGTAADGVRDRD